MTAASTGPAVPTGAPSDPVVVTVDPGSRLFWTPIAAVLCGFAATPTIYALVEHDWRAPGRGDGGTAIAGYLISGAFFLLFLLSCVYFFRFRIEIWPDRLRKRILLGFRTMRLADTTTILFTPRRTTPRGVVDEKWLMRGRGTDGRRLKVTIDRGLIRSGDGPAMLRSWIATRPDLEPSLFGRTSTEIHDQERADPGP